ncbi:hypothetical protein M378DRAFT_188665 [Amanita muscaria Koide BX008]|uniref:CxC2-like cysteine cluster KDZ transposase-associated domain-containing protein n=1 Tax=Amanita muscaria (strain Koide BX008) TaxID=946122 RepID=A0A0C2WHF1_AMAMK|nr:hypothetical protein M378DRAFT_188665 [Amanita muscaria Koide BX008]
MSSRQMTVDHSKPTVHVSTLHISSSGRVGRKTLRINCEVLSPAAPSPISNMPDSPAAPRPIDDMPDGLAMPHLLSDIELPSQSAPIMDNQKKKKMANTTAASKLSDWLQFRDTFLMEMIRGYGLGDYSQVMDCATCHSKNGRFRCLDCFPRCPLRCAESEWNGTFFKKKQLKNLGLRVQLGHGGRPCPCPVAGPSDFVVIHTNGAHHVNVDLCDCGSQGSQPPHARVQLLRMGWFPATFERPKTTFTFELLRLFHNVMLQGKTTLYDFYHAILQRTDNLQLEQGIDRYHEFLRVFRIWQHLQALKRAGRGHDPAGSAATSPGELVLECPACPQPGKNLPQNWEDAKSEDRFLYTLFLAIDANFKLKQKERGLRDIKLSPGWGCYVESSHYEKHVAAYKKEPEINSCGSDHNAIARANMSVPGYSVNGVGLSICSRHCIIRGNGAVDLEKGEKYCSMDYMVLSALAGVTVPRVLVSYDIGCQWLKNWQERTSKYEDDIQLSDDVKLEIGIPSWHVNGHGTYCRNNYSFNYLPSVGQTCGEDIETSWLQTNSLAPSTREMGSGARKETLDDHWNGPLFLKRFRDACVMRKKHAEAFEAFSSTFKTKTIAAWTKMVEEWISDRTKPNPYEEPVNTTTLQDVHLELAKENAEAMRNGALASHEVSLPEFLIKGLELEEQQRTLRNDVAQMKGKQQSSKQSADVQEKRNALFNHIQQWRNVQLIYMPLIPLFLPSSIPISLHDSMKDVAAKELRLRKAQAEESLEAIRRGRCMITGLAQFKKLNVCGAGNKPNTRMRTLYDRLQRRIKQAANYSGSESEEPQATAAGGFQPPYRRF